MARRKTVLDKPEEKEPADPAERAARILNRVRQYVRALHNSFVVPDTFLPDHPEREKMVLYLKERAWRGTDAGAASVLNIPLSTLDEWRKIPEFAEWEQRADRACADLVEENLLFLAYTGDKEAIRRVLEGRRPERYAQRVEHTGRGGGPVEIRVVLGDIPRPERVKPDAGGS